MPSHPEFIGKVGKLVSDCNAYSLRQLHTQLHSGDDFRIAEQWAEGMITGDLGFYPPPTKEQIIFIREMVASHQPTKSGLPDHAYDPPTITGTVPPEKQVSDIVDFLIDAQHPHTNVQYRSK